MKIDNHPFTKAFINYVRDNNLTTINALFESLKKLSEDEASNKIKGDVTEGLARWFFLTHSFYQHWTVAYTAKNAKGIDLILRRAVHKKYACQVKFRKHETISEEDLGTFGTHTWLEGYEGGIIFSNVIDVPEIFRNNDKIVCILKNDILKRNNDLLDIVSAAEGCLPKPYAAKKPWKLQVGAVEALEDKLPSTKRGKYLSPPGTGKTFIQSEVMRILLGSNERIYASFAPTIKLVNQNADNFYRQLTALGYNVELLVVNSGGGRNESNVVPTTDYATVRSFLKKASLERRKNTFYIVSCCYASCELLAQAWRCKLPNKGVGLFDEAHNMTGLGDKSNTKLVTNGFFPSKRKYFFTATEKVYDGDKNDIIAMNHEEFGDTLYEISVRQAIESGMIKDYKLVTVGVDAKFVNKYWDSLNENAFVLVTDGQPITFYEVMLKIVLYKAVKNLGLKRPILHFNVISNAVRMNEFLTLEDDITKHFGFVLSSEVVYSDLGGREIDNRIHHYINRDKSVLCATQLLSEGVDIEGENGERPDSTMFCDNRKSTISIWQSAGRGLRLDKTDPTAISHIIVPIVEGGDEQVFNDCMETIKNVLTAIAMNDEAVQQEITVIANGKKRPKKGYKVNTKHIDLDIEQAGMEISLVDVIKSIQFKLQTGMMKADRAGHLEKMREYKTGVEYSDDSTKSPMFYTKDSQIRVHFKDWRKMYNDVGWNIPRKVNCKANREDHIKFMRKYSGPRGWNLDKNKPKKYHCSDGSIKKYMDDWKSMWKEAGWMLAKRIARGVKRVSIEEHIPLMRKVSSSVEYNEMRKPVTYYNTVSMMRNVFGKDAVMKAMIKAKWNIKYARGSKYGAKEHRKEMRKYSSAMEYSRAKKDGRFYSKTTQLQRNLFKDSWKKEWVSAGWFLKNDKASLDEHFSFMKTFKCKKDYDNAIKDKKYYRTTMIALKMFRIKDDKKKREAFYRSLGWPAGIKEGVRFHLKNK